MSINLTNQTTSNQNPFSLSTNSGTTVQIQNSSTQGWQTPSISPSTQSSHDGDRCGHPTNDGSPCELDGHFDDGRCHHHTEEQCFYVKDDGEPCELPGSQPDGRCHHHTSGCNESLTHNAVEKACYHGLKYPYRMLGLHRDTNPDRGPLMVMPESAARVAAEVGKGILECLGEEYDREESHAYYEDNIISRVTDDETMVDWLKSKFTSDDQETAIEVLKKGIEKMWRQVNDKEKHADAARTAIAAAEHFLGEEVEVHA